MKLTLDARLISNSGIGVYLQNVISKLLLTQFEITVLHTSKDFHFFKNVPSGINLVPYNATLYSVKELIATPAKTLGADIFWSPHYNVPLMNFASTLKVVTIHDVYHLAHYDSLNLKQRLYAKYMMQLAITSADIIFTVSEFSKKEIIKYTSAAPDKIKVAYNGIDFEKYNKRLAIAEEKFVLSKYHIVYPYILFVGNIKPHKNLKKALLGFKEFVTKSAGKFENIVFVIVGKQGGFITGDDEIAKMMEEPFFEKRVLFTGWVADGDLPVLYQRAALFIFPSLYEGFGFPPLEAMAAGCPVASSNSTCLKEIYEDAAFYFDPTDIASIANALETTLSEEQLRSSLVQKGLAQAKKYNWNETMNKKINLIQQNL
jgi:glycosyltransferase involved in cell wall biosynthesis